MTLLELILACAILMILSSAALPIARYTIVHKKEELLRYELRQMRDAIDRYKDLADSNKIRVEVGTEGYPGPGNTSERRESGRRRRQETSILAADSGGPDDRAGRLGIARGVG